MGFGLWTNPRSQRWGIPLPTKAVGPVEILVHKLPQNGHTLNPISKDWIFQSKSWPLVLSAWWTSGPAGTTNWPEGGSTRTRRRDSIFYIKKREHYLPKSDQIFQNIGFQNYEKSNQNTYFYQRPISYPLQWIQKGDLLGDCAASTQGELALGKNLLVAYMPWEGFNFEDAVLINNKVLSAYTSLHIEKYDLEISELEKITPHIPGIPKKNLLKLDKNGIVQIGSWVQEGDILVGKIIPIASETQTLLTHEKLLYDIVGQKDIQIQERCLRLPQGSSGRIIRISYTYLETEQNRKNSLHQPLSESSWTKFKTKVQTEPASLRDAVINKAKQTQGFSPIAKRCNKFSQPSAKLVKAARSFFPFFVQNLQYSYFMSKSFSHFCRSASLATARDVFCILNLGLWRNRTGSNDPMTVFEKMYMPKAHPEALSFGARCRGPAGKAHGSTDWSEGRSTRTERKGKVSPWPPKAMNNGAKRFDVYGVDISSSMRKNKKFVTVVSRWLYKSLGTKNNYLFIGIGPFIRSIRQFTNAFYKTSIAHGSTDWSENGSTILKSTGRCQQLGMKSKHRFLSLWDAGAGLSSTRLDPRTKINFDQFASRSDAKTILNKRFCCDGSIKYICPTRFTIDPSVYPPRLAPLGVSSIAKRSIGTKGRQNREAMSFFLITTSLTLASFLSTPGRLGQAMSGKKTRFLNQNLTVQRQTQSASLWDADLSMAKRFKNFISINQRNFQKVVFEKPNYPIQIPKIIPRISTLQDQKIHYQRIFQKNHNRLRQQSQTKLLRTPSCWVGGIEQGGNGNFKNIWNFRNFCQNVNQFGPSLPLNAFKKITIYIAEKREFQVGDKISGRHGNKGIISQIFSNCDMPYLVNGDTLDVLLNPLGVPSRMNVGQILECLLGFTGQIFHTKFQILCFDEIYGYEASRSFIYSKIFELCQKMRQKWLFSKKTPGKLNIFDGRNGQLFHQSVMVGSTYLMKLIHIVDEKIHARGTGPYSLITQQPLRGRAKHGGQRFGEMEVWALQGFGSAYTLQELLTVKSDDLQGRNQIMQTLLKNTPLHFGTPESLRVVLRELQCLCLDLQLSTADRPPKVGDVAISRRKGKQKILNRPFCIGES